MGYAPPELFSGQADARVDIYSLGATIFHFVDRLRSAGQSAAHLDFYQEIRARARLILRFPAIWNGLLIRALSTSRSIAPVWSRAA